MSDAVTARIQTPAELAAMAALGCGYGQGHLFGRPGPLPSVMSPPAQLSR